MSAKTLSEENTILRGLVGSTAHGTGLDGHEDRDEMGVCIEPPDYVCGLGNFEQYIFRTQPEGTRSGPGDLDLVVYSLRKFCHLAYKGNPSILMLMWLPEYEVKTVLGSQLTEIRSAFVSREAGWRYLGYLTAQRQGLTGERNKKVARPELVERFGYDTKYAMHALRLGLQGVEYLTHKRISIPVQEPHREYLRSVRRGEVSLAQVIKYIGYVEAELRDLTERCSLQADLATINRYLVEAHHYHWKDRGFKLLPSALGSLKA
jgi:predicted nucleotidyltransferase